MRDGRGWLNAREFVGRYLYKKAIERCCGRRCFMAKGEDGLMRGVYSSDHLSYSTSEGGLYLSSPMTLRDLVPL